MGKDYYSELGVPSDAPFQEIAAAFRKLAITYHPLRNTDKMAQANYRFCQVCEAYEVLSNRKFIIKFLALFV